MATINVQEDCENSPKKQLIRDIEIAFANSDGAFILNSFSDDIHWEMVGEEVISGKKEAELLIKQMTDGTIAKLDIENIITHGDVGSANGMMTFKDGTVFNFCDIYTFTSHANEAKIKKLKSYVIEAQA